MMYDKGLIRVNPNDCWDWIMEDFRLVTMRLAAQTVARWRKEWGDTEARQLVIEHLAGVNHGDDIGPKFRAAYLTAFGH